MVCTTFNPKSIFSWGFLEDFFYSLWCLLSKIPFWWNSTCRIHHLIMFTSLIFSHNWAFLKMKTISSIIIKYQEILFTFLANWWSSVFSFSWNLLCETSNCLFDLICFMPSKSSYLRSCRFLAFWKVPPGSDSSRQLCSIGYAAISTAVRDWDNAVISTAACSFGDCKAEKQLIHGNK